MIPRAFITEWSQQVPWQNAWQVEQDLIISKALQDIYNQQSLHDTLAFRGGTALNKLFLKPALRYSEDIDLVQVSAAPIGETLQTLRAVLDSWLGEPKRVFSEGRVTLIYRCMSEDGFQLKLKVEINSREHFSVLGWQDIPFSMTSSWHTSSVFVKTYRIEEILGTKMRALYQRRKGRDLYDVYMVLTSLTVDPVLVMKCFREYIAFSGSFVSRMDFDTNIRLKLEHEDFKKDMLPLLPQTNQPYDAVKAYACICENLLSAWG